MPTPPPGGVLVRVTHSVISVGTEKMKVEQAKMNLLQEGQGASRPGAQGARHGEDARLEGGARQGAQPSRNTDAAWLQRGGSGGSG